MVSAEFCSVASFSGLVDGFRFECFGCNEVAREAARSVSRAILGTENKGRALRHVVHVA